MKISKNHYSFAGYIGCYVDQHPNRDLKKLFTVNNLTPDSCRSVCKQKGHVYAGVQYGYLCHCGDEYGKYGEAGEHECDSSCLGDEAKKCGGFWRNSVYTSGMLIKFDFALLTLWDNQSTNTVGRPFKAFKIYLGRLRKTFKKNE